MPAIVVPNTVEVRLLWSLVGAGAVNVLHATATGGLVVNQALANTLGSAIKSSFGSTWGPHVAANRTLSRVGVRDLRGPNLTEYLDTGAVAAGTGVGDPLPPQAAICITLRTGKAGKSYRGRVYLPGGIEADNDTTGTIATAASTAAVAFITGIQSAMTASGLTLAVTSKPAERTTLVRNTFHADGSQTTKTLSETTAKSGESNAVTSSASRDARWETQRRRANAVGSAVSLYTNVAEATYEAAS